MLKKKESPLTIGPANNAPPLEIHRNDGDDVVQDAPPDSEILDANVDDIVPGPPPDLEIHDEAGEDPGPAPLLEIFTD